VNISLGTVRKFGAAKLLNDENIIMTKDSFHLKKDIETDKSFISRIKGLLLCSCFYPTTFPNGDLYFCYVNNKNSKICNIVKDNPYKALSNFNKLWLNNIRNVISSSQYPCYVFCNFCPIKSSYESGA
jgi:hypothetical protein